MFRAVAPPGAARTAEPPIDIGREEAADAAERELSKGVYHQDDPTLLDRFIGWLADWLERLLGEAVSRSPGGLTGILIIFGLVMLGLLVLRWRLGPLARARARARSLVFPDGVRTAAEHRALAERYAASGDFDAAVRERFRALVRDLEERTVIDERPGRTADEAAAEIARIGGAGLAPTAYEAARVFDEVNYGGRHATAATYERVVAADQAIRDLRPAGVAS